MSEIIDGVVKNYTLCHKCAEAYFKDDIKEPAKEPEKTEITPVMLLKAFLDLMQNLEHQNKSEDCCPNCGLTLKEIEINGELGCLKCCDTFGSKISPLLQGDAFAEYLSGLKVSLSDALKKERYEDAIVLREKIKKADIFGNELSKLKTDLSTAIKNGNFDKAHQLRTEITKSSNDFMDSL